MREVWITGTGAVSGAGPGIDALLQVVQGGRSAVGRDDSSAVWAARVHAAEDKRQAKRLDRAGRFFRAACEEAWYDAGLCIDGFDGDRSGLFEGSSWGPLGEVIDEARRTEPGARARRATRLSRFTLGSGGATFAQDRGIRGPVIHMSAGSVSSAHAIGEAMLQIAWGRLDLAVCGGGEAPLHTDLIATFRAAGILGHDDDWPCRPFDVRRAGTVLGEGAGALVLEAADYARARGAAPRAVLAGFGLCTEAHDFVAPDPDGKGVGACAMRAIAMANTRRLAWVKAHGTGTVVNDLAECRGLAIALGSQLDKTPITSLKSTFGHTLGASGALEAVAAVASIEAGVVPATIGTETPDPALPQCAIVTAPRRAGIGDVLLLAESFGGRCVALVVRPA